MKSIPQRSNSLFCLPLVVTEDGPSVSAEIMAGIWGQIVHEGKQDLLFYDGTVKDLREWIYYIYNSNNHVVLIINDDGHIYHIAWINKFYHGHGFLHHCALGNYNKKAWPVLANYWANLTNDNGDTIVKTLLGVTPVTNKKAVKIVRWLGWSVLGEVPALCYLAAEGRHVAGLVSYYVVNEV